MIKSNKSLQVALFFYPDAKENKIDEDSHGAPQVLEFNPLLRYRFPGFFDAGPNYNVLGRTMLDAYVVGPEQHPNKFSKTYHKSDVWNSTNWFHKHSKVELPSRSAQEKQRMAAYTRAEASWRYMIPCRPAPRELHIAFRYSRHGILKSLKFTNTNKSQSKKWNENSDYSILIRNWLTFGVLYDIVEQAWFRDSPAYSGEIWFDYFSQAEHQKWRFPYLPGRLTEGLLRAFPHKAFGGVECVVVHLFDYDWHGVDQMQPSIKKHECNNLFQSKGSIIAELKWDEEMKFERRRGRLVCIDNVEED